MADAGWAQEISLDLDMVSALCPRCHILLVEANSNLVSDLGAAAGEAVSLGANVVSNSYGAPEFAGETAVATSDYEKPGVAMVAATGDKGYGVSFPAADPDVIAVGGTSLYQATNTGTRNATETAWSGAGSGCSAYEPKPTWQLDAGCPQRTVADVSADADPNTGVWVYDSYQSGPWDVVGGTSAAAPIVAAIFALAGPPAPGTIPSSYPYANPGALNDIVSGSNGSCGSYLCTAGPGYDGPTGLGTPNGIAAFSTKHSQTITFNVPTAGQLGGSALLAPTASSGLPVTLTVDPATSNGACTLAGYAVTYAAVGTCVLDANQAGDSTHLAATRVQREIGVSPTGGTMAFADMIGGIYTMADNGLGLQHVPVTGVRARLRPLHRRSRLVARPQDDRVHEQRSDLDSAFYRWRPDPDGDTERRPAVLVAGRNEDRLRRRWLGGRDGHERERHDARAAPLHARHDCVFAGLVPGWDEDRLDPPEGSRPEPLGDERGRDRSDAAHELQRCHRRAFRRGRRLCCRLVSGRQADRVRAGVEQRPQLDLGRQCRRHGRARRRPRLEERRSLRAGAAGVVAERPTAPVQQPARRRHDDRPLDGERGRLGARGVPADARQRLLDLAAELVGPRVASDAGQ